jgi:putative ABC transport system substrate-binding protein
LGGNVPAHTAKAATTTIPIFFDVGEDQVKADLVASIARPGDSLTRVNFLIVEWAAKRMEALHEMVPAAIRVASLVDPTSAATADSTLRDVEAAARTMGLQIHVLYASTGREIEAANRAGRELYRFSGRPVIGSTVPQATLYPQVRQRSCVFG